MRRIAVVMVAGISLMAGRAFAAGEVFDFNKEIANADRERDAINRFMVRAQDYTVSAVVVNKEIPLHKHDDGSHVLYIVSGHGKATLDGQPIALKPGTLVHIPKGVIHSITAKGGRITLVDFIEHAASSQQGEQQR